MQRDRSEAITLAELQNAELGLADARRVLQHGLEHRLQLARRTADLLQDLGGRRLLLQRLVQPVLEQRDLLVCVSGGRLAATSGL